MIPGEDKGWRGRQQGSGWAEGWSGRATSDTNNEEEMEPRPWEADSKKRGEVVQRP